MQRTSKALALIPILMGSQGLAGRLPEVTGSGGLRAPKGRITVGRKRSRAYRSHKSKIRRNRARRA